MIGRDRISTRGAKSAARKGANRSSLRAVDRGPVVHRHPAAVLSLVGCCYAPNVSSSRRPDPLLLERGRKHLPCPVAERCAGTRVSDWVIFCHGRDRKRSGSGGRPGSGKHEKTGQIQPFYRHCRVGISVSPPQSPSLFVSMSYRTDPRRGFPSLRCISNQHRY